MLRTQTKMARILTVFFLIFACTKADNQRGFISELEEKLENNLSLGNSEMRKMLNNNLIKPKVNAIESRGVKKMSSALLPIIFQVGATSTWLAVTALMAVKSVAIGIVLLVFKIAVSSAKVASFFTAWKLKSQNHDPWTSHYEHGHFRSAQDVGTSTNPHLSYNPDPVWNAEYKTLPDETEAYHDVDID